ncbi:MAG TPA: CsgG/HfaB family protein [Planctomycetota bacterium]|nr:CsgG/HfaB family protein [Planctomycetota bacterium]
MKAWISALALLTVLGCRGGEVRKEEAKVELKARTPRPFEARKRVAVVDFEDKSAYGQGRLGRAAADVLARFLFESQQFRVIERQQVAKVLEEQKFQSSGAVNPQTAMQVGKLLGVEMVAYGVVSNFGIRTEGTQAVVYQQKEQVAEAQVDVRLIHVETGEVVYMGEGRGSAMREVRGSFGLGGRMSYDETLAGDALRASIAKMVDGLIDAAP